MDVRPKESSRIPGRASWRARPTWAARASAPPRATWVCASRGDRSTRASLSSEPALSAAVGLDVAEALAASGGEAEVELLDVLVIGERLALAVHHHPAVLQDVAVVCVAQRDVGVLLGEQEAHLFLAVQLAHDLEDLLDQLRREAHR